MNEFEPGVDVPERIVAVCGVHGAGKTTVGHRLADDHDRFVFCSQTADWLLSRGYEPDPIESFQRAVFDHERARDRYLAGRPRTPVVESWHLGNVAYSEEMPVGDPLRVDQRDHIGRLLEAGTECVVLVLDLPPAGVWSRSRTYAPGNAATRAFERRAGTTLESFYAGFSASLTDLLEEFEISHRRIDATDDPATVAETAADTLDDLLPDG